MATLLAAPAALATSAATFAASADGATVPLAGAPQPQTPVTGHAQVIAQQIIEVAAGAYHWSIDGGVVDPGTETTPAAGAGFVVATGGTLFAVDASGSPTARLGLDEAMALAGDRVTLVAAEEQAAAYLTITITAGEPASPPRPTAARSPPVQVSTTST